MLPGMGHILAKTYLKGAFLSLIFAASGVIFLVARFLLPYLDRTPLPWVALGIAAAVWLYAQIDLIIRLNVRAAKDFQPKKDELLKAAQVAWLRDDYPLAEKHLRQILTLDERDVEAWIHLGKVLKSVGRVSEARMCFRSAVNLDSSGTWRYMLLEELGSGNAAASGPAATA